MPNTQPGMETGTETGPKPIMAPGFRPFRSALCVYPHAEGLPEKKYCPPLGLEYIASVLEGLVETVTLVDQRFEPDIDAMIAKYKPELLCVCVNWDYQQDAAVAVASNLYSDITVIFGGRHATVSVEELFAQTPRLDIIVRGDGEEIIHNIASGVPLRQIANISYRENGEVVHNKLRTLTRMNDSIIPNRKLRRSRYRLLYKNLDLGLDVDFISTSRGCPFHCKFCTFSNNPLGEKRPWSGRSAASVVAELKTVDAQFVFVVDDNFTVDMKRVSQICDLIIAEGIQKTFAVAVRIEVFKHPEILKKMFKAGFKILTIGIESAQDKTLEMMQKGFDTALAEKAFAVIRKVGFYIHGYFIVGCIGENEAEMIEIASFANRLKLDTIDLCLLRTEKFSPLNAIVAENNGYRILEDGHVVSDAYDLEKLKAIRRHIRKDYYTIKCLLRIGTKIFHIRPISIRALLRLSFVFMSRGLSSRRKAVRAKARSRTLTTEPPASGALCGESVADKSEDRDFPEGNTPTSETINVLNLV
ncbi:MAG: B12-binding domain-containing radical SAM protein [Pirellulales bacterium]|nr:B12-binding domain-containing radical SAM protein [Pirellulales bacterium]